MGAAFHHTVLSLISSCRSVLCPGHPIPASPGTTVLTHRIGGRASAEPAAAPCCPLAAESGQATCDQNFGLCRSLRLLAQRSRPGGVCAVASPLGDRLWRVQGEVAHSQPPRSGPRAHARRDEARGGRGQRELQCAAEGEARIAGVWAGHTVARLGGGWWTRGGNASFLWSLGL